MANYAYMGKGIVSLTPEAGGAAVDVGNVSALNFNINENIIRLPNYRTAGGGTYAQVNRIESVEFTATLHDLSPANLAMVLFGTATEADGKATIEALTTGAQTFEMVFAGINEAATGKTVTVTVHRAKIGAAQGLGFIGDEFAALEITGEVLIDTSITTAGLSQFFKIEMDTVEA
ncbi:hypothetical protein [Stutzerimonas nitrititolerans]|uniref:hypothetical protein n=1 Tax=Stutzerimonas nitrititolerans TaxID=2482751 RepID=UPI0028AA0D86|nr:hypothetical protein [Stutzerimonas nitrititolerans]